MPAQWIMQLRTITINSAIAVVIAIVIMCRFITIIISVLVVHVVIAILLVNHPVQLVFVDRDVVVRVFVVHSIFKLGDLEASKGLFNLGSKIVALGEMFFNLFGTIWMVLFPMSFPLFKDFLLLLFFEQEKLVLSLHFIRLGLNNVVWVVQRLFVENFEFFSIFRYLDESLKLKMVLSFRVNRVIELLALDWIRLHLLNDRVIVPEGSLCCLIISHLLVTLILLAMRLKQVLVWYFGRAVTLSLFLHAVDVCLRH